MCSLQLTSKMAYFSSLFHHADITTIKNCISFISCMLSMYIYIYIYVYIYLVFLGSSAGKESACNAGGPSLIPGSGRSPGEGNGHPLRYSEFQSIELQRVGHD